MVTENSLAFAKYLRESKLELAEAFKTFAAEYDLTLHDVAVMVAEKPGLGRLKFVQVAEVVLQQVHGRPEKYTQYYEHLKFMLAAVQQVGQSAKFSDVHGMASIRAKAAGVELIPGYAAAYQYAKKVDPEFFAKNKEE